MSATSAADSTTSNNNNQNDNQLQQQETTTTTTTVKRPQWTSSTPGGYVPVKKEYVLVGLQKTRVDASANAQQQQQQSESTTSTTTEQNNTTNTTSATNDDDDETKSTTTSAQPKLKGMWTGKERANAVAGAEKTERPTFEGEINFLDRDGIQKTKFMVKNKNELFKVAQSVCQAATNKIKTLQQKDGHKEGESKPLSIPGPIIGIEIPPPKEKAETATKTEETNNNQDSAVAVATSKPASEEEKEEKEITLPERRQREEGEGEETQQQQQQQDAAAAATSTTTNLPPPEKHDKGTKFSAREHINEILRLRTYDDVPVEERRKKLFDNQLILAPLTTVGNLPFRRICKEWGADVTCGEMALSYNLNQLQKSEWSLLRRHESEDKFGLQIAASRGGDAALTCALLQELDFSYDWLDINCCCPVALICNHGCGCALFDKKQRMREVVQSMYHFQPKPVTVKTLLGPDERNPNLHRQIAEYESWGAEAVILHGRSYRQRYTKVANWDYIEECSKLTRLPLIGNGDILSWEDVVERKEFCPSVSGLMIGRGALIKPWIFEEIKQQKTLDISSHERFEMLKKYCKYGLAHWGADEKGVATTRRFLLEWLSFMCRYVPVGLMERLPQKINDRPPLFQGRDDMETLLSSDNVKDWIKLTEMMLGPVGEKFSFTPKHKSNSYSITDEEKKHMVTAAEQQQKEETAVEQN